MILQKIIERFSLSRRLFLIFLFCVLIPLILFLSLYSLRLEDKLKEQAFQRMRFQTKTLAISIMDRLLQLEGEMRFFISTSGDASREKSNPFVVKQASKAPGHFEELIYVGPNGAMRLLGVPADAAAFSPADLGPISSKKPTLIHRKGAVGFPQLWMAVSLSDSEFLIESK